MNFTERLQCSPYSLQPTNANTIIRDFLVDPMSVRELKGKIKKTLHTKFKRKIRLSPHFPSKIHDERRIP